MGDHHEPEAFMAIYNEAFVGYKMAAHVRSGHTLTAKAEWTGNLSGMLIGMYSFIDDVVRTVLPMAPTTRALTTAAKHDRQAL